MSPSDQRIILAIESAVLGGSISLFHGSILLTTRVSDGHVSRAENLLSDISDSLDEVGLRISDVEALAVSVGPGSYTGVRIGIATMLGLRQGLDIPSYGISAIEAMSLASDTTAPKLCVLPMGRQSYSIQKVIPDRTDAFTTVTVSFSGLTELIESSVGSDVIVHSQAVNDLSGSFPDRHFIDAGSNLSRYVGMAVINGFRLKDLDPIYATAAN